MRLRALIATLFVSLLLGGCTGMPEGARPVDNFELDRYLGRWYEIARLDHSFERGLQRVSADYDLRDDGGVRVVNQGFDTAKQEWQRAEGKAYFIDATDVGRLKVSFFGPFYGAYNVIALDDDYRYAMVSGPNLSYLWILAREPQLDPDIMDGLLSQAADLGFDTDALIKVDQQGASAPAP